MTAETQDLWQHVLPPSTRTDTPEHLTIPVHVPHGSSVVVVVADEQGQEEFLEQVEDNSPPREVNGVLTGRARFALGTLTPGRYMLRASLEDGSEASGELVIGPIETDAPTDEPAKGSSVEPAPAPAETEPDAPAQVNEELPEPEPEAVEPEPAEASAAAEEAPAENDAVEEDERDEREAQSDLRARIARKEYGGRNWGISAALYAMRSNGSWGIGDLADLADVAVTAATAGADYLLLTPLALTASQAIDELGLNSSAGGGLVIDPVYLRPEDIREVAYLPSSQRTMLEWGSETIRSTNTEPNEIDFAEVWEAKRAALEIIYTARRSPMREESFHRFVVAYGRGLAEYVHAAVAAETEDPEVTFADLCADSTRGAAARREHKERIEFHLWLQWAAREQLARAHTVARNAGMRIGLIHTASAAMPVTFDGLVPYAGGIFLTGLDIEADGADAQEAAREAGLLLFTDGRDPQRRAELGPLGIIPQTTLWSEFDGEDPHALEAYPEGGMAAVTTIEEPPTAGFLAEEHLDLRNRLGLLAEPYEEVRRAERIRRERLLDQLRARALVNSGATERQLVEALYRYLAHTPAQFITVTLSDAVGNRRPFVLGGPYPDWRYPYTDGANTGVLVDELRENARFTSLVEALDAELRGE